jgi:periplasmic copper chaperone A
MKTFFKTLALCSQLLLVQSATAHVVLDDAVALVGANYRASFRVAHGCDASPTTAIQVFMPAGFQGAKPMPKPGWTLRVRRDKLTQPYSSHGKTVTDDVVEISWTANGPDNALPDEWYEEFVLRGGLPAEGGPLWFRVRQTCANGSLDWSQIPANGTSTRGLKAPAVLLEVIPSEPVAHQH